MKKTFLALTATVAVALFASCTATIPVAATSNPVGSKVGESSYIALFGLYPLNFSNDARGVKDAADNGGIKRISTVDFNYRNFFVFAKVTTVVTGD